MAGFGRLTVLIFSLVILFSYVSISVSGKKAAGVARKEDIQYIKCHVCEKIAHHLYQQVQSKQAQISPQKISEFQIIEIAENICNLKKKEADWILKIDIVEQGDELTLVEHDSEGQCDSECKTIERACQEVIGDSDTDVAEYLYSNKPQVNSLTKFLCNILTRSCSKKPPPVPKDRIPGEPFIPKSEKEAEMEKLMKSMEGMPGAPGMKMYSREDLMKNKFGTEDADEDDDVDDEDEVDISSKLGKVLRDKENTKIDWRKQVTKKVTETGMTLRRQAYKISNRAKQWWKSTKTSFKKKSSKSSKAEL